MCIRDRLHGDALIDTLRDALVETWISVGIPFAGDRPAQGEADMPATPLVVSKAGG